MDKQTIFLKKEKKETRQVHMIQVMVKVSEYEHSVLFEVIEKLHELSYVIEAVDVKYVLANY